MAGLRFCSIWSGGRRPPLGGRRLRRLQAAQKLEQADNPQEAFLAYACIPGTQHLAVRIGRAKPAEYLALLQSHEGKIPAPLAKVVAGDLRLAEGDTVAALACYRAAAKMVAAKDDQGWATGHIPADAYIVEQAAGPAGMGFDNRPVQPLTTGPGSHRDNWLIRRFISLEAWDDAAAEFARVWAIHCRNTRPYRVLAAVGREGNKAATEQRLVRPYGFDSQGLQFALDYAFFLRKIDRLQQALAVIEEPLLAIDMDRNPSGQTAERLEAAEAGNYPLREARPGDFLGPAAGSRERSSCGWPTARSRKPASSKTWSLCWKRKSPRARTGSAACWRDRFHEGKIDEALRLELAYIEQADFDPLTAACRQGMVYEEANRPADAAAAYERRADAALQAPPYPIRTRRSWPCNPKWQCRRWPRRAARRPSASAR